MANKVCLTTCLSLHCRSVHKHTLACFVQLEFLLSLQHKVFWSESLLHSWKYSIKCYLMRVRYCIFTTNPWINTSCVVWTSAVLLHSFHTMYIAMNLYPFKIQLTNDSENSSSNIWAAVIGCSTSVLPTVSKLNIRDGKGWCSIVVEDIWVNGDSLVTADVHWAASSSSVLPCDSGYRNCICCTCECDIDDRGGATNVYSLILRRRRDSGSSWKKERVVMAASQQSLCT